MKSSICFYYKVNYNHRFYNLILVSKKAGIMKKGKLLFAVYTKTTNN